MRGNSARPIVARREARRNRRRPTLSAGPSLSFPVQKGRNPPLPWIDFMGRNLYLRSMKAIISEKGQVTIPKALRDRLGIRAGQVLDFSDEQGRLVATKATETDPVESVYGILSSEPSSDALIASMRGEPDAV